MPGKIISGDRRIVGSGVRQKSGSFHTGANVWMFQRNSITVWYPPGCSTGILEFAEICKKGSKSMTYSQHIGSQISNSEAGPF
jgi:hypothetical protein